MCHGPFFRDVGRQPGRAHNRPAMREYEQLRRSGAIRLIRRLPTVVLDGSGMGTAAEICMWYASHGSTTTSDRHSCHAL